MGFKRDVIQISFSELTFDDHRNPNLSKKFSSCIGCVNEVTPMREDRLWKIALKRRFRRNERVFTCPIDELEEEKAISLLGKRVRVTTEELSVTG